MTDLQVVNGNLTVPMVVSGEVAGMQYGIDPTEAISFNSGTDELTVFLQPDGTSGQPITFWMRSSAAIALITLQFPEVLAVKSLLWDLAADQAFTGDVELLTKVSENNLWIKHERDYSISKTFCTNCSISIAQPPYWICSGDVQDEDVLVGGSSDSFGVDFGVGEGIGVRVGSFGNVCIHSVWISAGISPSFPKDGYTRLGIFNAGTRVATSHTYLGVPGVPFGYVFSTSYQWRGGSRTFIIEAVSEDVPGHALGMSVNATESGTLSGVAYKRIGNALSAIVGSSGETRVRFSIRYNDSIRVTPSCSDSEAANITPCPDKDGITNDDNSCFSSVNGATYSISTVNKSEAIKDISESLNFHSNGLILSTSLDKKSCERLILAYSNTNLTDPSYGYSVELPDLGVVTLLTGGNAPNRTRPSARVSGAFTGDGDMIHLETITVGDEDSGAYIYQSRALTGYDIVDYNTQDPVLLTRSTALEAAINALFAEQAADYTIGGDYTSLAHYVDVALYRANVIEETPAYVYPTCSDGLISNCRFDTLTGWTQVSTIDAVLSTAQVYSGTNSLKMRNNNYDNSCAVSQSLAGIPQETGWYTLSVRVYVESMSDISLLQISFLGTTTVDYDSSELTIGEWVEIKKVAYVDNFAVPNVIIRWDFDEGEEPATDYVIYVDEISLIKYFDEA